MYTKHSKRNADKRHDVQWDDYETGEVKCFCGVEFIAKAAILYHLVPTKRVTDRPCPGCKRDDHWWKAEKEKSNQRKILAFKVKPTAITV